MNICTAEEGVPLAGTVPPFKFPPINQTDSWYEMTSLLSTLNKREKMTQLDPGLIEDNEF